MIASRVLVKVHVNLALHFAEMHLKLIASRVLVIVHFKMQCIDSWQLAVSSFAHSTFKSCITLQVLHCTTMYEVDIDTGAFTDCKKLEY